MPKHDMEDIFRKKLEDFEPQHGDRWEQIAAALPEEKKRRGAFWLWLGTGMVLLMGVVAVVVFTQTPAPNEGGIGANPALIAETQEIDPTAPPPLAPRLPYVPSGDASKGGIDSAPSEGEMDPAASEGEFGVNPLVIAKTGVDEPTEVLPPAPRLPYVPSDEASEVENGVNPSTSVKTPVSDPTAVLPLPPSNGGKIMPFQPEPELSEIDFTIDANGDTIRVRKTVKSVDTMSRKHGSYGRDFAANGKWSMGIGLGMFASTFDQRMPQSQGNTAIEQMGLVQRNQELREKMEKPGIAFSQSLWIHYQPDQNWSFNAGISMVQTTQNLAFNIKSQVPDNYKGPADFPESGASGSNGQYLFSEDSILPGNGITATNKYFSREIPVNLNYHFWINRNFQLQLCAGVSYRWVTGASVYFADIDNVGMIYMQGADYYPGLQNTWHIQGGIALNYQINNYFSLNMMPVVQYAIQSNIRHKHYVQQYQRQWGLQVQLSRKLGF